MFQCHFGVHLGQWEQIAIFFQNAAFSYAKKNFQIVLLRLSIHVFCTFIKSKRHVEPDYLIDFRCKGELVNIADAQ